MIGDYLHRFGPVLRRFRDMLDGSHAEVVAVDGDVTITDGGGSITVDGPLTDEQLRATPILVGAADIVVTVTPTVDTGAYAGGDLLFDSAEVANAVRANGYSAILESVTVLDKADQGVPFTLLIANANTDFGAVNGAPDPDDIEAATVLGWVPIATTDYVDLGASKVACIRSIGLMLQAGAATTSLWIAAINGTGTPTYGAATDLVIKLGFLRA